MCVVSCRGCLFVCLFVCCVFGLCVCVCVCVLDCVWLDADWLMADRLIDLSLILSQKAAGGRTTVKLKTRT